MSASNEPGPAAESETPAQTGPEPDELASDDQAEDVGLYTDDERKTFPADYYS